MLILLSPSKTQDFDSVAPTPIHTEPDLLKESELLMKVLGKLTKAEIKKTMGISDTLATLNAKRFKHFETPFTPKNAKQAIFAFQGDVYDGFDVQSLDTKALAFAQAHIRIISGLYGILRPLDLIQPYRLEMKTKLKNPRGADLYAFWGDKLTETLNEHLKELEPKVIINLASEEYAAAIDPKKLEGKFITPQFREKKGSAYKMIGLLAKKARGRMARYIAMRSITVPDALQFFSEDGYRLNVSLSRPENPVYARG